VLGALLVRRANGRGVGVGACTRSARRVRLGDLDGGVAGAGWHLGRVGEMGCVVFVMQIVVLLVLAVVVEGERRWEGSLAFG
jgi:hypothetical protein